ncbi:MotA/TolQ/ExbB proton channel family protein [Alphaproteobacteria bacterium endosymbiont of Tiliacea citrago]|uniref:MotA/TolQ/ExbB proton channel family protein n=1 Tax=Alphaproteobacteria bacterium endosymbiont of Tiliacea citrago TaxID=3077944 RepID=UPI00313B999A
MLLIHTFFSADFIGKLIILTLLLSSIYSIAIISKYAYFFYSHDQLGDNLKLYLPRMKNIARINAEPSMYLEVYDEILDLIFTTKTRETFVVDSEKVLNKNIELIFFNWENQILKDIDNISILGSIAPFVGLLGTVLGIMSSFQAIAASNSNSITVVAPALSEALCVTAMGIFVAIPANIGANYFYAKLDRLKKDLFLFKSFILKSFNSNGEAQ